MSEFGITGTTEVGTEVGEVDIETKTKKEKATVEVVIIDGEGKKNKVTEGLKVELNGTTWVEIECSKVKWIPRSLMKDSQLNLLTSRRRLRKEEPLKSSQLKILPLQRR